MRFNGTGGSYNRGEASWEWGPDYQTAEANPGEGVFQVPHSTAFTKSTWKLCDQDYPTGQNYFNNQPIYGINVRIGPINNLGAGRGTRPTHWLLDFGISAPRHGSDGVSGLTSGGFGEAVDIVFEDYVIPIVDEVAGQQKHYIPIYVPAKGIPVYRLAQNTTSQNYKRWWDFLSKGDSVAQTLASSFEILGGLNTSNHRSDTTLSLNGLAVRTWSSWIQVGRLNYRSKYLSYNVFNDSTITAMDGQVQLGYGEPGEEKVIYQITQSKDQDSWGGTDARALPVSLPAGTAISIRIQLGTTQTNTVGMFVNNYY